MTHPTDDFKARLQPVIQDFFKAVIPVLKALAQELQALEQKGEGSETCKWWREDGWEDSEWRSSCDELWNSDWFLEEPQGIQPFFCSGCGKRVEVINAESSEESEEDDE